MRRKRGRCVAAVPPGMAWLLAILPPLIVLGPSARPSIEAAPTDGVAEALREADRLAAQERYQDAARLLSGKLAGPLAGGARAAVEARIGRYFLHSNVLPRALQHAEAALLGSVDHPEALWVRGETLRRMEKAEEARETLERLLRLAPDHDPGRLALGRVRLRLGDPKGAIPLLESFLAAQGKGLEGSAPDERDAARLDLARALAAAGRLDEAADQVAVLLERDPHRATLYSELSRIEFRRRRPEAGKFYQQVFDLTSKEGFEETVEERLIESGRIAYGLGQRAGNRARNGHFRDAFRLYEEAIGLEPKDPRFAIYHADFCLRFTRASSALGSLDAALARGALPASGLHRARGRALLILRRWEEAAQAFRAGIRALEEEGSRGGTDRGQADGKGLAGGLAEAAVGGAPGQRDAALEYLQKVKGTWPGWEPHFHEARLEVALERPRMAQDAIERAIEAGGGEIPEVRRARAEVLAAAGDGPGAERELGEILRRRPEDLESMDLLLRIRGSLPADLAAQRERTAALRARIDSILLRADSQPLSATAADDLQAGIAFLEAREAARAQDCITLALELNPDLLEGWRILVSHLTRSQDIFERLRVLRQILRLSPRDPAPLRGLATLYLKLHLRLDEAKRFAEELRGIAPTPEAEKLLQEISSQISGK